MARRAEEVPPLSILRSFRWFWEGFPLLKIFRHPAGGVVGSRPDRRVTFLRGQESNQRNRLGPLPAPWTPGAVVPDLRPLCAFSLEPSSGLSAAWGNTRLPPPTAHPSQPPLKRDSSPQAPTPLSLPLERGGGPKGRRGSTRPLSPSVEQLPPNPIPSIPHYLKTAAAWYAPTPHAALS